jgi:acyl-[acyl carrier protein]--UDP-N-acetylglucosamine O-acyltransferase
MAAIIVVFISTHQISQDVPKYMMVCGGRAELRGLNLEGLRRNNFSITEVLHFLYKIITECSIILFFIGY